MNRSHHLDVDGFPATPEPFGVFMVLIDGQGEMEFELVILRPDDLEVINSVEFVIQLTDPLQESSYFARIEGCTFPIEGDYHVSLLAAGESVAHCRLSVLQREIP